MAGRPGVAGLVVLLLCVALALAVAYPNLPDISSLTDYRPKLPLRVYLGRRRAARRVRRGAPQLCAHRADPQGHEATRCWPSRTPASTSTAASTTRAWCARRWPTWDARSQGASTITMQVARNFYLSTEKTFTRKIYEILLAFKIESLLSKDQILELYMNQIFLGQRAYGFAAASARSTSASRSRT
jgi:penicillin-binding protein 1A